MRPAQFAKSGKEHGEQVAVFAWAAIARQYGFTRAREWMNDTHSGNAIGPNVHREPVPELRWLHAIPNGGSRGDTARSRAIRGAQLKAEGVRVGIADIFLPVARVGWHGLYLELKRGKGGVRSEAQIEFGNYCANAGYAHRFCAGHAEAIDLIEAYLRSGS